MQAIKPPSGDNQREWDAYLKAWEQELAHCESQFTLSGLMSDYRIDTVKRPTEYDAMYSILMGRTVTRWSYPQMFSGTDRAAYSKPTRSERKKMIDMGIKTCSGVGRNPCTHGINGGDVHSISMFYRNKATSDGWDNLCIDCRKEQNRIDYQDRKARLARAA